MKTTNNAYNIIKYYESCYLTAYQCPSNIWTIGYGHTDNVQEGLVINEKTANLYLEQDIKNVEDQINNLGLKLNQNQFDAIISFVFNVGIGNFKDSTLYKYINKNVNDARICQAFCMWIKSNNSYLKGLARRRIDESKLYFK